MSLRVSSRAVGPLGTNCHAVYDTASMKGVVIDPGYSSALVAEWIKDLGITATRIVLTHGHFDHVTEAEALAGRLGVGVYLHPEDRVQFRFAGETEDLLDGDSIPVGDTALTVIHTPGHTRGSVCLYNGDDGILISGDTLFCDGIGRTDLPGGSYREIMDSIRNRLLTLPPDTRVYPGHGPSTTVADEAGNHE